MFVNALCPPKTLPLHQRVHSVTVTACEVTIVSRLLSSCPLPHSCDYEPRSGLLFHVTLPLLKGLYAAKLLLDDRKVSTIVTVLLATVFSELDITTKCARASWTLNCRVLTLRAETMYILHVRAKAFRGEIHLSAGTARKSCAASIFSSFYVNLQLFYVVIAAVVNISHMSIQMSTCHRMSPASWALQKCHASRHDSNDP